MKKFTAILLSIVLSLAFTFNISIYADDRSAQSTIIDEGVVHPLISDNSDLLYKAPAIPGTIVGALTTENDRLSGEVFAKQLDQTYVASTRAETIANFEKISVDGGWYRKFNSMTEEEQSGVECRPENFAQVQKEIYGKDTLWGFKINMEWYTWFNSLTSEEQKKVAYRPEKFAQVEEEVFNKDSSDWGVYTEVKENLPIKFYRVDEPDTRADLDGNESLIDLEPANISMGVSEDEIIFPDESNETTSNINESNEDLQILDEPSSLLPNINVSTELLPFVDTFNELTSIAKANIKVINSNKSVNSMGAGGNIDSIGGNVVYSMPSGWATYSNNGSYCSLQYLDGTGTTARVQVTFLNTANTNNQVSLWNPVAGSWQNLAGVTFGLQQAVTGAYNVGNMISSLTYTIRAKTYEAGAWRECILYIKADDGLLPTGGGELAYSTLWNIPGTGQYVNSNCYTYALGFYTNRFGGADPGYFAGKDDWPRNQMDQNTWKTRVEADMQYMFQNSNISQCWKPIANNEIPGYNGYRVAGFLYIDPDPTTNFRDYHFYKQDAFGKWSHKLPNNPSYTYNGTG